jgi:hypothetical protein
MNKYEMLRQAHQQIVELERELNLKNEFKNAEEDARRVSNVRMPKEMSEWLENNVIYGNYLDAWDGKRHGFAMKSRDCTIVFYPNWNCDQQFSRITNTNDTFPRTELEDE